MLLSTHILHRRHLVGHNLASFIPYDNSGPDQINTCVRLYLSIYRYYSRYCSAIFSVTRQPGICCSKLATHEDREPYGMNKRLIPCASLGSCVSWASRCRLSRVIILGDLFTDSLSCTLSPGRSVHAGCARWVRVGSCACTWNISKREKHITMMNCCKNHIKTIKGIFQHSPKPYLPPSSPPSPSSLMLQVMEASHCQIRSRSYTIYAWCT